jgi:hypothetical protein
MLLLPSSISTYLYAEADTFGSIARTDFARPLFLPQISPGGNNIFLLWQDNSTGSEEIYLRKSTNGGITFGNTTNVSNNTGFSTSPQIESFGNNTFVFSRTIALVTRRYFCGRVQMPI